MENREKRATIRHFREEALARNGLGSGGLQNGGASSAAPSPGWLQLQADAREVAHAARAFPGVAIPVLELLRERFPAFGLLARCLCESSPRLIQLPGSLRFVGVAGLAIARLGEPLPEQVLLGEVALGFLHYTRRAFEPLSLPVETAVDHPAQDAGPFG